MVQPNREAQTITKADVGVVKAEDLLDTSKMVPAAAKKAQELYAQVTKIHDQIKALKKEKSKLTDEIDKLEKLINSQRKPSPLGNRTIGG